jgi:hypothetical protein
MSLDEAIEKSRSRGKHSTPLYNKLRSVVGKLFGRNKGKGKTNTPNKSEDDKPSESPVAPVAPVAEAKGMTFKQKFAAERKAQGAGGKFDWNGKSYSTNRADDVKPAASGSAPTPPQSVNGGGGIDTSTGGKPDNKMEYNKKKQGPPSPSDMTIPDLETPGPFNLKPKREQQGPLKRKKRSMEQGYDG